MASGPRPDGSAKSWRSRPALRSITSRLSSSRQPPQQHASRQEYSDVPGLYKIGVVSERVGLSPGTLRLWEDQYGLLTPLRFVALARGNTTELGAWPEQNVSTFPSEWQDAI